MCKIFFLVRKWNKCFLLPSSQHLETQTMVSPLLHESIRCWCWWEGKWSGGFRAGSSGGSGWLWILLPLWLLLGNIPTPLCTARAPLEVKVLFDPRIGSVLLWLLLDDEDPAGTGIIGGGKLVGMMDDEAFPFDVTGRSGATTELGTTVDFWPWIWWWWWWGGLFFFEELPLVGSWKQKQCLRVNAEKDFQEYVDSTHTPVKKKKTIQEIKLTVTRQMISTGIH